MTTIKKVINYFMMFTQFLQKINLKRSLFACLLWSLLAFSLQANLTLEKILQKDDGDGVIYYYDEKGNKFFSKQLFYSKEKEGNDDEEELDTEYIFKLVDVYKKVLAAIDTCKLEDIQTNTHGLRVFLAQLFAFQDYEMKDPFHDLITKLNMKKGEDNKTGLDVIFYERTDKSQSFLYHVLKNGWEKRWKVEEDIEYNNNSGINWNEWHQKKANKLVDDLKTLSIDMQKIELLFPKIEIDALLQTTEMEYKLLFDYFLQEGSQQPQNGVHWLNEKYLMKGSYSVTFLYKFLLICYDKYSEIKMKEEKKQAIFHLINQDNQGINILQPNDKNINSKMSPTAFVEACYHDENDAIFLLEKIKETYKNNKDKEKEAIDYLNKRGGRLARIKMR